MFDQYNCQFLAGKTIPRLYSKRVSSTENSFLHISSAVDMPASVCTQALVQTFHTFTSFRTGVSPELHQCNIKAYQQSNAYLLG